jgi:hypothetical protein
MADTNGTTKTSVGITAVAGSSAVAYLNIAATWTAADTMTVDSDSEIVIHWKPLESTPSQIANYIQ